jgi:hypothetical protein
MCRPGHDTGPVAMPQAPAPHPPDTPAD